jgi:tryptophan-rich sensory protein
MPKGSSPNYLYHETPERHSFTPPKWLFGTVWTILYPLVLACYGFISYKVFKGDYPRIILAPLAINLISNFLYRPIQFRLKNNYLALIDIIVCLGSLVWLLTLVWNYQLLVFGLLIPYLLWSILATVLQLGATFGRGRQS